MGTDSEGGKSENVFSVLLVFARIPGQTPLWADGPYHWPPTPSACSKTAGSRPSSLSDWAATRPLGPAPTTATPRPLWLGGGLDPPFPRKGSRGTGHPPKAPGARARNRRLGR